MSSVTQLNVARRAPTPRPQLSPEAMARLTTVSSWKSIATILACYGAVVALAFLGGRFSNYWLALPAFVIIAGLQHHLATLLHEGAHFSLHPNRRVNDLVAEIFCAIPFFTTLQTYRLFHLAHHRHSGSREKDPEVQFYEAQGFVSLEQRTRGQVIGLLLKDLFLVNLMKAARRTQDFIEREQDQGNFTPPGVPEVLLNLTVWGMILVPAIAFGYWKEILIFWILPSSTLSYLLLKLHGYGEHTGSEGPTEYQRTFIHAFNPITNFFLYPVGSAFHLEHHLMPTIPWYNLKKAHRHLVAHSTVPGGASYAHLAREATVNGYFFGSKSIYRKVLAR